MDPRTIFDYKCHNCKRTKEPGEFGYNKQTKTKRVTCNPCHQTRTEAKQRARDRRATLPTETGVFTGVTSDTSEEGPRVIVHLPSGTTEEEPVCENACFYKPMCTRVSARYTCSHLQCFQTHCMLGRCIACGCSTLRFDDPAPIWLTDAAASSSSSGPARREDEPEPEGEPVPECDFCSIFVTSEY
jgi:hypothetical protein